MSDNPKIAVCTTFPNDYWHLCAAEMLATFRAYWPEDVKVYIQLDEQDEATFAQLNDAIMDVTGEGRAFIAGMWDDDQKAFMERWKDHKPKSYMDDVVRFSHKIFALEKCADAIKDEYDYLIWLDADVITKKEVTYEWLKDVLPGEDEICSYLGRTKEKNGVDYSECGWVVYNLKAGGHDLLKRMKEIYVNDVFDVFEEGWTDCHVFDASRTLYNDQKSKNLSESAHGTNVWPFTKLAEKMVHRKGNRKHKAAENRKLIQNQENAGVVDVNNLQIKTKNCLDHKKICENVNKNKSQIRAWATLCNPTTNQASSADSKILQEIVICSAGPSLSEHIDEIKAHQRKGNKIIAVKHAIETLKAHDITPWAVVLLDPRAHVEGFVKEPDPEPVYFVASMCDTSVVKSLNDARCAVIGYHAFVNAGEVDEMIPADLPVSGGSATATRSISLFADMFGYKTFHLYGYDLCHWARPDMNEKTEDGQPKYIETTIGTHSYGNNKYIKRTFWTEGQFLAQSNELRNLYKERKDLNITVYGDGLAGWLYKHHKAHTKFQEEYNAKLDKQRSNTANLDEFVHAVTRGSALSRGE